MKLYVCWTTIQTVPVLVTDEGEVVTESQRIVEWARQHPAAAVAETPA